MLALGYFRKCAARNQKMEKWQGRVAALWQTTRSLEERRLRSWTSVWVLNSPRTVARVAFERVMESQELNLQGVRERLTLGQVGKYKEEECHGIGTVANSPHGSPCFHSSLLPICSPHSCPQDLSEIFISLPLTL